MSEKTDKINGGIGFGYKGEKGDEGEKGANILFSPINYGDFSTAQNSIPFESGNSYVSFDERLFRKIKSGDYVIITGDNGTKMHMIIKGENSVLYVRNKPEYDIDMEELPKYQYNATVYTGSDNKIWIQHLLSIDDIEKSRIVGFIDGERIVFKDYGKTEEKFKEPISTGKEKGEITHQIIIFMYYKVSPYKVIKTFLYETTY